MVTFTPEVEALQGIINELRVLTAVYINANSSKGSQPVKPALLRGPRTAMQTAMAEAERAHKRAKHEALVARVLPNKRRPAGAGL